MTDQGRAVGADESSRRTRRIAYGVGAVKWIFVLALLRLFAAPMSKDLLGEEILPMPTWEWSLCALTPGILMYASRRPEDWQRLRGERTILKWALGFYLVYALVFAISQGEWVLWIAVLAGIGGFAGIKYLNHQEVTHAR
ncbi:hypothetical protein F7R91_22780 [Streptomyces luteolifulvus]|jgi:hypothetical protein|uniref:Integral membrane protein n=1 Tax=Streptomyces luteolifulvus TaxID=2615112 RepID=A0A6H9UYH6_9ACTN|nr:hypothetical protein [Streptomyces luteolifulvus]KAB1144184.1 hypothetical protein F7R91_22780 [Streptomyces luteolifulvus]